MKNLVWILAIMVGSSVYAQKQNQLQGPEAKNYKPWKYETEATVVVNKSSKKDLKGPEAKNFKPWKDENSTETIAIVTDNKRRKLQGPAAKNYKPWRD